MATIIALFVSLATLTTTPNTSYSGEADSTPTTESSIVGGDITGW